MMSWIIMSIISLTLLSQKKMISLLGQLINIELMKAFIFENS